jgi:hypothetical protein
MLKVSIRYSNLIQVSHYIQRIYCCVLNLIFVFLFCRYIGSGLYQLPLVLIQYSNLIETILCIQWINRCVLNLIFVFLRCDFHALLLMLAAMFLMKPAYLQLNAMRSTWLQVAVPRADGNSLHSYAPCIDCLVLYIVIVFVGLICLWFLFLTLDQEYVDAAMLYRLFHCIYTLQFWLIRRVWFIFVNGYIHVNFYY